MLKKCLRYLLQVSVRALLVFYKRLILFIQNAWLLQATHLVTTSSTVQCVNCICQISIRVAALSFNHKGSPQPRKDENFKLRSGFVFRFSGDAVV